MSNHKTLHLSPACIKTLTKVEVDPASSHQREFNGVFELKQMLGEKKQEFNANFSIRGEEITQKSEVTWYEAREKHPTRSEYRLYFKPNGIMNNAHAGDNIIIGFDKNQQLHFVLIKSNSETYEGNITNWTRI